jgi:hypothetical protein
VWWLCVGRSSQTGEGRAVAHFQSDLDRGGTAIGRLGRLHIAKGDLPGLPVAFTKGITTKAGESTTFPHMAHGKSPAGSGQQFPPVSANPRVA